MSADRSSGWRLPHGGRIDRSKQLSFEFANRRYLGHPGDTLASALLANGVRLVARSWKLHRPRGILGAGVEEPCALVQLGHGAHTVPNLRVTEVPLVAGLVAQPVNAWPSVRADWRVIQGWFARLLPAGFYYKTFMASPGAWRLFERGIRAAGGLGKAPIEPDPDVYDSRFAHCDVLVVGAGIAGLCAARAAGRAGARVILLDEQLEPGGWLLSAAERIDGQEAGAWLAGTLAALAQMPEVTVLRRCTAFGYHDQNLVTALERLTDDLPAGSALGPRERLWKIRARRVIIASGSHERPLVFANNDLPGVMLASAVCVYLRRFAVLPGRRAVVFTNNDQAYEAALALQQAGASVQVIDARPDPAGGHLVRARAAGVQVSAGFVVTEATGWQSLRQVTVQAIGERGLLRGSAHTIDCDLLAVSGGFSPVIHLQSQSGARPRWDEQAGHFVSGDPVQAEQSVGSAAGLEGLAACAADGTYKGLAAAGATGFAESGDMVPMIEALAPGNFRALWRVPHRRGINRAPKQFVDLQNDVTAADLALAVREGFESIEHVKRYTAMGFGTDQGKTGNVNGLAIVADLLGRPVAEVGTTTFRPNYTPVAFGALAGRELGPLFDPVRRTVLHEQHVGLGAVFEDVGQWQRAYCYPRAGEQWHDAVQREARAVRETAGLLDASTLGKIDIQGPDALKLLEWVYCNHWRSLAIGACRYGLMLDENGMVFDDGVTARLGEHHYLMHTTTGGAARVLAWMEFWLQTEWPHLQVWLTSVTEQYATLTLAGPHSRAVLAAVGCDIDLNDSSFPFMSLREGRIGGIQARVLRVSFSGERSYEINVSAGHGPALWQALMTAGRAHGLEPYGTEAMHLLRAEKGFIIVGQETDGSMTPDDLGMGAMVARQRDFLGRRSLSRRDTVRTDRLQLVGLLAHDPARVLTEGAQIVTADQSLAGVVPMIGHVTSAYFSPTVGRSIALALVAAGRDRLGQAVDVVSHQGERHRAIICAPVFVDPPGARQHD